jgi:hypothetical protein
MNRPLNPYEAPHASLAATNPAPTHMPRAMIAALACYLIGCVFDVVPLIGTPMSKSEMFVPAMTVLSIYTALMAFALWRRRRWARAWVVLTTAITAFFFARMLWRGVSMEQWDAYVASLLRIAATVALLMPSSRRWFAAKTG